MVCGKEMIVVAAVAAVLAVASKTPPAAEWPSGPAVLAVARDKQKPSAEKWPPVYEGLPVYIAALMSGDKTASSYSHYNAAREKCTSTQFECANKKCVNSSSKCNGKNDCGDNSDEANCPTTCQCGIPNISRIVNGNEVNPKRKYPWQIGLVIPGYYIICGGSIINDRWILTAAHCVVDKNTCRVKYDSSSSIRVALGEHDQSQTSDDDLNTKKYSIKTYIKHPNYNCKTPYDYDFALLELTEAIPFNNVIRPICLPKDDSKTYAGQTATVSGWGLSGTGGSLSNFLKEVQIPVLANDKCGDWNTLAGMKVCAGQSGKNSCEGDSGGPLSVVENNKMVQIGVVSYAHQSGCASSSYPSVYARVSKVISWISTNTGSGKKCD